MMENKYTLPCYTFGWRGTAALIGGGFLPLLLCSTFAAVLLIFFKTNIEGSETYMMVTNVLMWCGAIFCFDYFACRPETHQKLNFNFSRKDIATYFLILPMMMGMMLIAEYATTLIPVTGSFWGPLYDKYAQLLDQLTGSFSTMLIMTVLMAPIFEEIVFRGIILKGMTNKGVKPISAIWISSIIFGLVHANPWQFVGAVLLGFVLGTVYYRTGSLLLPMLLHGFNNLCSTLLITFTQTESFSEFLKIPEFPLLIGGALIFVLSYIFFVKKYSLPKPTL